MRTEMRLCEYRKRYIVESVMADGWKTEETFQNIESRFFFSHKKQDLHSNAIHH